MESVSRPFHSRKLSNSNQYDDVLSGKRKKHVTSSSSINVEDYKQIFGSISCSSSCSIPVLNLSTCLPQNDVFSINFLSSNKPDYNDIFGSRNNNNNHNHNNNDQQLPAAAANNVVSYGQLFGPDKTAKSPSSTTSTSQDLDDKSRQSSDVLKQFNMSYNKIGPKSKDGLDGTKHVTQLHATPGYTCFIDEPVQPKMEAKKHKSSPVRVSVDSSTKVESVSEDKKFKTFDIDFKRRPSTVSSASTLPTNVVGHKSDPMKSTVDNEACKNDSTSTYEDGELDVNSDASASAAALRKAIEKAQESIRIAKESVGRKKKGLKSFSNRSSKNSIKVERGVEDITATSTSSQGFPNFMDVEKLFGAKKVIDEINGKFSKSVHSNKVIDSTVVSSSTEYTGKTESRLLDSPGKDEYATLRSEAVDTETGTSEASDFVNADQTNNMFVDDYEGKVEVSKTATGVLENQAAVYEQDSVERELDETVKDEARFTTARELLKELNNLLVSEKVEYEKKESQGSKQNDNGSRLNEFEKERQEEVLDQEDVEIVDSAERHGKEGEDETSDEGIEDTSEWLESENESKDDHTQEETSKIRYDVFEIEMEMEVKENARTCDNSREESEVNLQHNFEMKQEDNLKEKSLDDTFDQEYDENSSGDDNVIEETGSIDDMETTQEVEHVTGAFSEFQVEETESMKEAYASEEEGLCEKIFIDQTVSDHNEDQYEVKSEENDIQSETSSGSIHDVKIEVDEAIEETTILEETNIQIPQNEMPDIGTTNEIKASHKPGVLNETQNTAEDEVGEIGPSKVSGKENSRRIDEATAKNNRLAVDRAIREARERAFAEARERAERERAAVEKATEEVRQRMMAEALEKVAKASKPSSDRTSTQSKLRAERAAVERATSEARQRALEKAMSQKSVSDLNSSESALRSKAKLDKHNRIMERAAKALAEKEKRDLLAQKEQAERNRLSENLDADIKRWSKGKEGNLRALLSTLQYILGPQSGWQPVTMTEIISSSAVKKAYRKATLCVHPDKLQQRGASIQHKYICEKVFDLLKAAWNRFNSEER